MQLKSINFSLLALLLVLSAACSKKDSSSNPGRNISVVDDDSADDDVDDIDRGDDDTVTDDDDTTDDTDDDTTDDTVNPNNILLTSYRNTIPNIQVCKNVLEGRNADTLKKFFGWDIQNLEGPVFVCFEQENVTAQTCPNGENYCSKYPTKHVRVRIEYEDDNRFWFYDSEKASNYGKLISYVGGAGSSHVSVLFQDGAGFLRIDGDQTSVGTYDVSFAFADRPTYSKAKEYDSDHNYSPSSAQHRAASLLNMKRCAESAGGNAKYTDGTDCAARFVFAYQFFSDLNTEYSQTNITDIDLWIKNQVKIANQYVDNAFPAQFSSFAGYQQGVFGRLKLNGL